MLSQFFYGFCFVFIYILQTLFLNQVGLPEYDSVRNFFIIKEITEGNFANMFQHGSPTFFLFFAFFYKIYPSAIFLLYLNAILTSLAIVCIVHIFSNFFNFNTWQQSFLLLFVGSSTYLVYGTRSLSIESMTLLGFSALLWHHNKPDFALLQFQKNKASTFFWLLTALLLTINYKILLFFPVILFIEFLRLAKAAKTLQASIKEISSNQIAVILSILIFPIFSYILLGMALGVSWKSYPASWFFLLIGKQNSNPWREFSPFAYDIDFYFQYLLFFESPILLLGFILFIAINKQKILDNQVITKNILIILCILAGMSILPKAPRGILLILPLLYVFAFRGWHEIFAKFQNQIGQGRVGASLVQVFLHTFVSLAVCYQIYSLQLNIYRYTQTNYQAIANYLIANKIDKVAATVGINLRYFLPQHIDFQSILFEKDTQKLQIQGYNFLLIDDYHRLVGADVFDKLRQQKTMLALPEKTLLSPLLYLEHCEFTGNNFAKALTKQKEVAADSANLRLIRLE
jgi:hypothetical protein